MNVSIKSLLPKRISWQIMGLVAISLVLGNLITFVIVSYELRNNEWQSYPEAIAAEVSAVGGLLAGAPTDAVFSQLIANARHMGIAVENIPPAALKRVPAGEREPTSFAKELAERRAIERGISVLGGFRLAEDDANTVLLQLPNGRIIAFRLPSTATRPPLLGGPALPTVAITGVFIILISVYAVWAVTAPLTLFAAAAEAFGRSLQSDQQLPERGPWEIAQMARALNTMRSRISALIGERTAMLIAIGHDLRTPLTRIILQAERFPESPIRQRMVSDLANMTELLSNMLSYLRGGAPTELLQAFDLPSLLQTVCVHFTDSNRPMFYRGPNHLAYTCRPRKLIRALSSIADHILQHHTTCALTLSVVPAGNLLVEITRADHRSTTSDDCSEESQQSSLGLSMARSIIQDHAGVVAFMESRRTGVYARIILPAEPAASLDQESTATRASGSMLNHAAPPPTDGRTASDNTLNRPKYRLSTAQSWIGSGTKWTRAQICRLCAPAVPIFATGGGSTGHLEYWLTCRAGSGRQRQTNPISERASG